MCLRHCLVRDKSLGNKTVKMHNQNIWYNDYNIILIACILLICLKNYLQAAQCHSLPFKHTFPLCMLYRQNLCTCWTPLCVPPHVWCVPSWRIIKLKRASLFQRSSGSSCLLVSCACGFSSGVCCVDSEILQKKHFCQWKNTETNYWILVEV